MKSTVRFLLACSMLAGASAAHGQAVGTAEPVRTQQGLIKGAAGKAEGVTVFKNIPFAAPPVGQLRFAQPQAPVAWEGVRDGSKYGNVCMQNPAPTRFPPNGATDTENFTGMSEDCLNLNIWTPAKQAGEKLPVMVWLYGGAYNEGGGNAPFSEGDNLAAKGVVMVTLNYRVGPFGFFSHPELTAEGGGAAGNPALGDAIAAYKGLKANVAAFGGDPNNITLFGESAGAAMNGGLAGAAGARGTFERAIAQSGAWMGLGIATMTPNHVEGATLPPPPPAGTPAPPPGPGGFGNQPASAELRGLANARQIGAETLAQLRALPAAEVQQKLRGHGMIVDGKIITEDLSITFAEGRQNPVDVLAGSNADEGSFAAGPPTTADAWRSGAGQRWGAQAALGLAAYPATTDAEAQAQAVQPFTDTLSWHMRLFAEQQAKIGKQSWHYFFTHDPLYDPDKRDLGSAHTGEIPYVFDNLAAPRTFPGGSSVTLMAGNAREEAFADQVSQYFVNFARTGNPNGNGLPQWPAMKDLGPNETMILDADGSGKGPWIGEAKDKLYTATYEARVAGPLGIGAGGD
ncbi:MAG TPA: carboxylesterase family protein [Croceibacterium sp.]